MKLYTINGGFIIKKYSRRCCGLRILGIVGALITVVIIGFAAVIYLNAATAPVTGIPEVNTPYGSIGGASNPGNVIDTAREIASFDKNRTQDMQNILDRMDGKTTNQ
jgi:hypothetical protein